MIGGSPCRVIERSTMDNQAPVILYVVFVMIFVFIYLYYYRALTSYLEKNHTEKWRELGDPSLTHTTVSNNINMTVFIFSRKHIGFNDARLSESVKITRTLFIVTLVLLIGI